MGLQEIFNKLHNTNLAKEEFEKTNLTIHKVDLNKVEDTIKEAAKIGGGILGIESDILSLANEISKEAAKYDKHINQLKQYLKAAKELGATDIVQDANSAISHYENKQKRAEKMLQNVKSAIKI